MINFEGASRLRTHRQLRHCAARLNSPTYDRRRAAVVIAVIAVVIAAVIAVVIAVIAAVIGVVIAVVIAALIAVVVVAMLLWSRRRA